MTTVQDLRGRIVDCDSHLYITPSQMRSAVGEEFATRYARLASAAFGDRDPTKESAGVELDAENVWTLKDWASPGSFDAVRRIETIDLFGVQRQMIGPDGLFSSIAGTRMPGVAEAVRRYNDWTLDWARPSSGRLRPTAILPMHDVETAIADAQRIAAAGGHAVSASCSRPPAGLSPADPAWDPLWAILAEAGLPLIFHVGSESRFLDKAWSKAKHLTGGELDPFSMATGWLAPQTYLTTLLLGGVLERHPGLRIGVMELTAQWIGPFAEMLDHRVDVESRKLSRYLSQRPSEYISRQVRLTPYWWEPVDVYIERFGLADVYCFATDFPHSEGGVDPLNTLLGRVQRLGDDVVEKLFVRNGEALCP